MEKYEEKQNIESLNKEYLKVKFKDETSKMIQKFV